VTDRSFSTVGQKFLRGYQDTNANGLAEFVTIYPVGIQAERFTSTLRFAPFCIPAGLRVYLAALLPFTDQIHAQPPYAAKRTLKNDQRRHLSRWGEQLVLPLTKAEDGYVGTDIGLQIVIPERSAILNQ